jgi:hypothetical protein
VLPRQGLLTKKANRLLYGGDWNECRSERRQIVVELQKRLKPQWNWLIRLQLAAFHKAGGMTERSSQIVVVEN